MTQMININYDPILGCTHWEFTPPERTPISDKEKNNIISNAFQMCEGHRNITKYLTRVPFMDKKGDKRRQYQWDLLQSKKKPKKNNDGN